MRSVFSDILNAFKKNNNQIIQLILINVFVFLTIGFLRFGYSIADDLNIFVDFIQKNIYVNSSFLELIRRPWTLIVFPFSNAGVLDLLFNCLAIFWFGNILTDFLGGRKVMLIYLIGSVVSVFFYMGVWGVLDFYNKTSISSGILYGCSPGIYAIMFAAVALLPDYELMFFRIFIKLRYLALAFLVLSLVINAHVGILNLGASIFGYLQVKFLRTGWNFTQPFELVFEWFQSIGKPKKKMTFKSYSKSSVGEYSRNQQFYENGHLPDQAEIDYLLDKINKGGGYESLTKEEKNRLLQASQRKD